MNNNKVPWDHASREPDLPAAAKASIPVSVPTDMPTSVATRAARVEVLRKDLASDNPLTVLAAVQAAGAEHLRELEADLERVLLSGRPRTHFNSTSLDLACLAALRAIRGPSEAAAAAVRYLDVFRDRDHPSQSHIRADLYVQIALADADGPSTLAMLLARTNDDSDKVVILGALGRHPSRGVMQWLLDFCDRSENDTLRAAALKSLAKLGYLNKSPSDEVWADSGTLRLSYVSSEMLHVGEYYRNIPDENKLSESDCAALRTFVLGQSESPSEEIRKAVVSSAALLGTGRAIQTLARMAAEDPAEEVRALAARQLQGFGQLAEK